MTVHWSHLAGAVPGAAQKYSPKGSPADQFIAIVCGGDLNELVKYVVSFQFKPRQLAEIVNAATRRINRQEVWIPNVAITTETHVGKTVERAILAVRADRVHRILVVSTNPDLKPIVAGVPKGSPNKLPEILPDDPALLFCQIARLFSLPQSTTPPPLSGAALPPPIPPAISNRPPAKADATTPIAPLNFADAQSSPAERKSQQLAGTGASDSYSVSSQRSQFMAWNVLIAQAPDDGET